MSISQLQNYSNASALTRNSDAINAFNRVTRQTQLKPAEQVAASNSLRGTRVDVIDIRNIKTTDTDADTNMNVANGDAVASDSVKNVKGYSNDAKGMVSMLTDKLKDIIGKMQDLAKKSASNDLTAQDRTALNDQMLSLRNQINKLPEMARQALGDKGVEVLKTVYSGGFLALQQLDLTTAKGAASASSRLDMFEKNGLYNLISSTALTRLEKAGVTGGYCGGVGGGSGGDCGDIKGNFGAMGATNVGTHAVDGIVNANNGTGGCTGGNFGEMTGATSSGHTVDNTADPTKTRPKNNNHANDITGPASNMNGARIKAAGVLSGTIK